MSAEDEFTPTTDDVRGCYAETQTGGEFGYMDNGEAGSADFDRWLAAHDAEVKAQALKDAADAVDSEGHHWSGASAHAFFRFADKLRERADDLTPEAPA